MDHQQAFNAVSNRIQQRLEKFPGYYCENYDMEDRIQIGDHSTVRISGRAFDTYLEIKVCTRSLNEEELYGNYGNFCIYGFYNRKFSFKKIGARIASVIYRRVELGAGKRYKNMRVFHDDQDLLRRK